MESHLVLCVGGWTADYKTLPGNGVFTLALFSRLSLIHIIGGRVGLQSAAPPRQGSRRLFPRLIDLYSPVRSGRTGIHKAANEQNVFRVHHGEEYQHRPQPPVRPESFWLLTQNFTFDDDQTVGLSYNAGKWIYDR